MTYATLAGATVRLTVVAGELDRREYVFGERTTRVLGRSRDCDPRLPDDNRHTTVSRHHCLLDINPPAARIRDLGSRNGTYVNGEKIGQRQPGQTPEDAAEDFYPERDLSDGDEIRIGATALRVSVTGSPTLRMTEPPREDPRETAGMLAGYAVIRELGRGGMGAVYLARHSGSGELVALKVMLPKVAFDEVACGRFLREIRITGKLRHPNIVTFQEGSAARGAFYFTSEYCAGGSLDRLIRGGLLPPPQAVRLITETLEGLAYAHGQHVVHRDISPHNILLMPRAGASPDDIPNLTAKVSDFGLAKAFDDSGLSGLTTRTGQAAGKPRYLPRHQVLHFKDPTPAVDVWATAACLYEALTGASPRTFARKQDVWRVVLQQDAVPIRDRAPSVPPRLAEVIDTALRERPETGFPTAEAFRDALLKTELGYDEFSQTCPEPLFPGADGRARWENQIAHRVDHLRAGRAAKRNETVEIHPDTVRRRCPGATGTGPRPAVVACSRCTLVPVMHRSLLLTPS